jgi:DNA-damage-inducible protein J
MATTKINVCVDESTKQQAERLLSEMGLTMTSAINMYLKRIIMEEAIPFEVSAKVPNATTIAALNEYEEMKNNPAAYKRYSSFKEAMNEVLENA